MKNILIAAAVVIVIVAGVFLLTSDGEEAPVSENETTSNQEQTTEPTAEDDTQETSLAAGPTITYTNDGFDAQSYEAIAGSEVTIVNNSSDDLEFSSDNHPTHTINTELNTRSLSPGQSLKITVERTGTWGIHDHLNSQHTTTLIVI